MLRAPPVEAETVTMVPAPADTQAFDVADTQALVRSNTAVNDEYFHLTLSAPGLAMNAKAGQFFNIACPATDKDLPYLRRPMSVYRVVPSKGEIEFLYKVAGAQGREPAAVRPSLDRSAMASTSIRGGRTSSSSAAALAWRHWRRWRKWPPRAASR